MGAGGEALLFHLTVFFLSAFSALQFWQFSLRGTPLLFPGHHVLMEAPVRSTRVSRNAHFGTC